MLMGNEPAGPGREEKETDDEKRERKRESAIRQAMYALTAAVELQAIDEEFLSDPKVRGIVAQIRSTLPSEPVEAPPIVPDMEDEEEPEEIAGPVDETTARERIGKYFGPKKPAMA